MSSWNEDGVSTKEDRKHRERVENILREQERKKREEERRRRVEILGKIAKKLRKKTQSRDTRANENWDKILRVKEFHLLLFSFLGLAVSLFQSFYKWDNRCNYYVEAVNGTNVTHQRCFEQFYEGTPQENSRFRVLPERYTLTIDNVNSNSAEWLIIVACQAIITGTTFVTLILLGQYYMLKLTERRREWSGMEEIELMETSGAEAERRRQLFTRSYNFWESSLQWQMLAEVIIHVIHPFILIEVIPEWGQTVYEVTECLVFLRMYLMLRAIYINNDIYILRQDIVDSNTELQRSGYQVTAASTYKIIFYQHPAKMISLLAVGSIMIFGFIIFVIERNGNEEFAVLFPDCYWFVWVTISTIGYGDKFVNSTTGKAVVVLMAITSLLIMTIFSGIVTNLLSPPRNQKYVQNYLSQKAADLEYKRAAVNLIVIIHREKKAREQMRNPPTLLGKRSPQVYAAIKRLRSARLELRNSIGSASDPVVDTKLQHAITLAHRINNLLDEQGAQIVRLDEKMTRSTAYIKSRVTKNTTHRRGREERKPKPTQQVSFAANDL